MRRKAEERIPVLRGVNYDRFRNAPESFTPDANFCLGETVEVSGMFVAAGFNSQGIIYGPGAGKALAEWMTEGSPTFDATAVDVQRFARGQSNRSYLSKRTKEALGPPVRDALAASSTGDGEGSPTHTAPRAPQGRKRMLR